MVRSFEEYHEKRARKAAFFKAISNRPKPCPTCGLYGCICQLNLLEFFSMELRKEVIKNRRLDRA